MYSELVVRLLFGYDQNIGILNRGKIFLCHQRMELPSVKNLIGIKSFLFLGYMGYNTNEYIRLIQWNIIPELTWKMHDAQRSISKGAYKLVLMAFRTRMCFRQSNDNIIIYINYLIIYSSFLKVFVIISSSWQ